MTPYIICEAGVNHSGNLDYAKQQIDVAAECGASVVKFQHYDALKLLGSTSPYLEYATKCQIGRDKHEELAKYCEHAGIPYAVSVFDVLDLEWAASLSPFIKVASRMNQDESFIAKALTLKKPVIMSVQKMPEVIDPRIAYMFCVTNYPSTEEDYAYFPYSAKFGISSHCPEADPSLKAAWAGARLFENHLALSKEDEGCDITSSIIPSDYGVMCRIIKAIASNDID